MNQPLLKASKVSKRFGKVEALKNVDFEIYPNEIVGLVGNNGAGKSTLIKIFSGVFPPDGGEIYWKEEKINIFSTSESRELGIETVFQERALIQEMNLYQNIFLGKELTNSIGFLNLLDEDRMKEKAHDLLKELELDIPVNRKVASCSGGERQGVAIARAMYFEAELVILDEPTTGLSVVSAHKVLDFVERLKKRGVSVIVVSHNIGHVYRISDRFVLLDNGKLKINIRKSETSKEKLEEELVRIG